MKLHYYHKLLVILAIGIFYTNVAAYAYKRGWTTLSTPKAWVLLFCVFSLPVLIRHRNAWDALKSPLTIWCWAVALITVLWFFTSSQSDIAWDELRLRFLAIIQLLMFVLIFSQPTMVRLARKALIVAVLIGVALHVYELFDPGAFSQALGRSAGLYENPTMAGEALVLGMVLSVTVLPPRYRGLFILVTGIGVFTTFSRSGIPAWVLAVGGLMLVGRLPVKSFVMSCGLALILAVLVLLPRWDHLLTTWERTNVLNVDVKTRLQWFTDPIGVSDQSGWERTQLVKEAWNKIAQRPFGGSGTGSSYEVYPPHNQYLAFMLDHGLVGTMILPLLILAAMWGARGETRGVAVVFACTNMWLNLFTHTIFNFSYNLILLSLMAAMAATSRSSKTVEQPVDRWADRPAALGNSLSTARLP